MQPVGWSWGVGGNEHGSFRERERVQSRWKKCAVYDGPAKANKEDG